MGALNYFRGLLIKVKDTHRALEDRDDDPFPDLENIDIAKLAGGQLNSDHASAATATSGAISDATRGRVQTLLEETKQIVVNEGDVVAACTRLFPVVAEAIRDQPLESICPVSVAKSLSPQVHGCLLHLNN